LKIIKDIAQFPKLSYPVVSVGRFDGVHIGHQKLLAVCKKIALEKNGQTVVITFDPGPEEILFEKRKDEVKLLNTIEEKAELLEQFGVDYLLIIPFTKAFSHTTSFDFVKSILVDQIHVKEVVMGFANQYGYDRDGDFLLMNKLANKYGFLVNEVPMEDLHKLGISSVRIRKYLSEGNIPAANKFLGYKYQMSGQVVKGNQMGRDLGYPTANIDVKEKYEHKLMPPGVYAVQVKWAHKSYYGMANIGYRPTIKLSKHELTAEVHIFHFNLNIYHENISMCFLEKLREEEKFDSLDMLKLQLKKDHENANHIISRYLAKDVKKA
jgi:riboflavin kinase/FMN adenylyltransferase